NDFVCSQFGCRSSTFFGLKSLFPTAFGVVDPSRFFVGPASFRIPIDFSGVHQVVSYSWLLLFRWSRHI
ncbi:MAG: hypothetical protein OSB70_19495, partial [Myxococcota bacterium]|nr:hypothetical protein [Myxococcota bacterium]